MSTLRELIMQEIVTVLGNAGALSGVSIRRNLDDLLSEENLPAVAFTWIADELYERKGHIDHHRINVLFRSGAKGATPDDSADSNLAVAIEAVMATSNLNGKAKFIALGDGGRDGDTIGARNSLINQLLTIQYTAKTGSLTEAAG
jgi:hypothetical protein